MTRLSRLLAWWRDLFPSHSRYVSDAWLLECEVRATKQGVDQSCWTWPVPTPKEK